MPITGYNEVYTASHAGLFIAAFALAFVVAVAGIALHLGAREESLRRGTARVALVLVALILFAACAAVVHERRETDTLLQANSLDSACESELIRHEGYGEARAIADLALWAAPLSLVLATYVAARSSKQSLWRPAPWVGPPWALFAVVGYLYLQPLPGRFLWAGRCELYDVRDAIFGPPSDKMRRACYDLSGFLKDPRELASRLGTDSEAIAFPELPSLRKRCVADLVDQMRSQTHYTSRSEILNSPLLAPEDRAAVTKTLDEIAPLKPWEIDAGDENEAP